MREFARKYARAANKGKMLVDRIWQRHGHRFTDREDWGDNVYAGMLRSIPYSLGADPYLDYLIS